MQQIIFLAWETKYELGVSEIDAQHRAWFKVTNDFLVAANLKRANTKLVQETLAKAVGYARYHFRQEEQFLVDMCYPADEMNRHCSMHNGFVVRLNALAEHVRKGAAQVVKETTAFLSGWLVRHVLESDIQYIRFYIKKKGLPYNRAAIKSTTPSTRKRKGQN